MADVEKDSRTHEPTPRRLAEARQQGEVARSREVNTAAVLVATLVVGLWAVPTLLARHRLNVGAWISHAGSLEVSVATMPLIFRRMAEEVAVLSLPLVLTALAAGVGAQLYQGGLILRVEKLAPDLTRLNPLQGLKRIVSVDGLVTLLKSVIKLAVVGYVAYRVVLRSGEGLEELVALSVPEILAVIGRAVRETVMWIVAALVVVAALDYTYEYYRVQQKLKMTRQEVQDELKATEGDVKVKRRFRKFHYQLTKNRMLAEVPMADVVLTNPVHVAVALRYAADVMRAPCVVAKGAGEVAEQIKAIARKAGVPIVERRVLARALFRSVKIGQEIPAALYRAVAEVLAYIYSLQRSTAASEHGTT